MCEEVYNSCTEYGFAIFFYPSVYMKALGSLAAMKWRTGYRLLLEVCKGVSGYGFVYEWLLSICCGSFLRRLGEIVGRCCSARFASASRRV